MSRSKRDKTRSSTSGFSSLLPQKMLRHCFLSIHPSLSMTFTLSTNLICKVENCVKWLKNCRLKSNLKLGILMIIHCLRRTSLIPVLILHIISLLERLLINVTTIVQLIEGDNKILLLSITLN